MMDFVLKLMEQMTDSRLSSMGLIKITASLYTFILKVRMTVLLVFLY